MSEEEMAQSADDPFEKIADTVSAAAEGAQDKLVGTKETAKAAIIGGILLSRTALYNTCYYMSYGVVYSSLMLASVVPLDNAMGAGLRDGADAARDAVQRRVALREVWHSETFDSEDANELIDSLDEEEDNDDDNVEE